MRTIGRAVAFIGLVGIAAAGGCGSRDGGGAPGQKVIGVTLLTETNDFFKDLEAGLREEAAKHGYRLIVQSADSNGATQARQLEDFVTKRVDAIVACPVNSDTVASSLRRVTDAKVPIFTADIVVKGADVVSHVASDNYQGGRLAGEAMARLLGGKGEVLIIDHPAVSSVQDRTRGFEDALKAFPGMSIVDRPSGEGQRTKAQAVMEDALTAHADVGGVFAINDESALGALRAVEASGRAGLVMIGYDATPEAQAAIRRGSALKADVIQYPRKIGAATIATIARYFAGEKVPRVQPVDVGIVTRESLGSGR